MARKALDIKIRMERKEKKIIQLTKQLEEANVALFGQTAKQWKNNNPSKKDRNCALKGILDVNLSAIE